MTKQELQKELLDKVKPGTKPSQLKKLKRSKSEGDIPKAPPLPNLQRSKSAQELESPNIENLETKISSLELKLEVSSRELGEVQAEKQILTEQLTLKQKEVEELRSTLGSLGKERQDLRQKLEEQNALIQTAHTELTSLKAQHSNLLDHNLALKHQSLKDWFQQYQKTQKIEKELASNINEASQELIEQDQRIASLQTENSKLKQQNQSLTKDLNLAHKLAQLRQEPFDPEPWPTFPNWGWSLISLTLTFLTLWIWAHD